MSSFVHGVALGALGGAIYTTATWLLSLARDARQALRQRANTHVIHLAEQPQFARLVEFAQAVHDQSQGDPDLQALVRGLRHDLAAMSRTTEPEEGR